MTTLQFNNSSSPKNRLRSLSSSPKPRQRNRGRSDDLLYQDAHEVVAQHKEELELSNDTDRESVSDSDHGSEEWELNLHALEALEMSDEPPQSTLSEEEPGCAWEFDASALECLEANTFDD